ncbi:hypothetical protein AB0M39_40210 [Streptomyces sp. NPDC051907]|uniref:hypothetical protein n=1 Tax=Streptomyces sp. NPDC051907 TaxID=3155284 RepID=UPI003412A178
MTKPLDEPAPRTVLHDSLARVGDTIADLERLLPDLRHAEQAAPPPRRQLAHGAVAQVEITLAQLRDAAVRLDTAKALVRSATAPALVDA